MDGRSWDHPAPKLPRFTLSLLTVLLGCWVALGELDRLVGMALADGYAASLASVQGPRLPLPFPHEDSRPWLTLHQVGDAADSYVVYYLIIDVIFALTYGVLLGRLVLRVRGSGAVPKNSPFELVTTPRLWPVFAMVAADILENILIAFLALGDASAAPSPWLVRACALTTGAKWLLLALTLLPVIYALIRTQPGRDWWRIRGRAVAAQRYSLLAFAPIAALALVPGPGVLDQLPDVQRSWFDGSTRDGSASGQLHMFWATLILGLIAFGLFILGRLITDLARNRELPPGTTEESAAPPSRPPVPLWPWAYGPLLLGIGLIFLVVRGDGAAVRWWPLVLFGSVPIGIMLVSWLLRNKSLNAPPARQYTPATVTHIHRLGDVLALAGPVVACLALVRSHAGLAALGQGGPLQQSLPWIGLVSAVAIWWCGPWVLAQLERIPFLKGLIEPGVGPTMAASKEQVDKFGIPTETDQHRLWWLAWIMIVGATVLGIGLCVWPVWFAHGVGALGAIMLALGVITLLVGSTVVLHGFYSPPRIFWTKGLRVPEAPVATLLTLTVLATAFSGSDQQVHGVRGLVALDTPMGSALAYDASNGERTVAKSLERWAERVDGCTLRVKDDPRPDHAGKTVNATPLVLVAAEGGGIRAAYWTAATLKLVEDALIDRGLGCDLGVIAIGSGVSGGAVGLSVSRFTPGNQSEALDAVWNMSGPDPLAQAALGLLLRDPVYTVAGLPITFGDAPGDVWLDRAGLMETAWEHEDRAPSLGDQFLAPTNGSTFAADLILNSTTVSSGCRVLVSTVTGLPESATSDGKATTCSDPAAPLPFSRDLVDDYMGHPAENGKDNDHCLADLSASTAAMLAARFPYVTPSGVLGPCGNAPEAQLIDGGYAESSGLGSLADLMPSILQEAATHGTPQQPVLPIVLYLDNGRGSDIAPPPGEAVSEVLVPPTGSRNAGSALNSPVAHLQRLLNQTGDPERLLPTQVFVLSQESKPTIEAPLGWVLSETSRDDMDESLRGDSGNAVTQPCDRLLKGVDNASAGRHCSEYPQLGNLLALLK